MQRWRDRRNVLRERGAAVVEAVLIFPLLLLLVFGVINYGLAFSDGATLRSSTRSGARIGAAQSKQATQYSSVVSAVNRAVAGVSTAVPQQLWIYNASGVPEGGPASCAASASCTTILWDPGSKSFPTSTPAGGWAWDPSTQWTCPGHSDRIGVTVIANFSFITGLFGGDRTLKETTILDLEPQGSFSCAGAGAAPTS